MQPYPAPSVADRGMEMKATLGNVLPLRQVFVSRESTRGRMLNTFAAVIGGCLDVISRRV